jgi:hypothetical protein
MSHLVRYLHVGSAEGETGPGRAHVPQLVRRVPDDAIGVSGGVALSELEVLAPGGVTDAAAKSLVSRQMLPKLT